jgi:hypothetical protein
MLSILQCVICFIINTYQSCILQRPTKLHIQISKHIGVQASLNTFLATMVTVWLPLQMLILLAALEHDDLFLLIFIF